MAGRSGIVDISGELEKQYPDDNKGFSARVTPYDRAEI
jgi:hypothetical protein